jgi:hypothetical protein
VIVALAMIAVVGVAMVALTGELRDEAGRTKRAMVEAELRAMLDAGATLAPDLVGLDPVARRSPNPTPRILSMPLPEGLEKRGGYLSVRSVPRMADLERWVTIEASLEGRRAEQTLRFLRGQERWVMVSAERR